MSIEVVNSHHTKHYPEERPYSMDIRAGLEVIQHKLMDGRVWVMILKANRHFGTRLEPRLILNRIFGTPALAKERIQQTVDNYKPKTR